MSVLLLVIARAAQLSTMQMPLTSLIWAGTQSDSAWCGLVHSREMKVIERYSELGVDGKDLAMLLLRMGRGRLGH